MLIWGVIPYTLAVLTPSWRWLLGCVLFVGGVLSATWMPQWSAASVARHTESLDAALSAALGLAVMIGITTGFAVGALVRSTTLLLERAGLPSRQIRNVHLFGVCLVPFVGALLMVMA